MLLTINIPDLIPDEKKSGLIRDMEHLLKKHGISFEIREKPVSGDDPWDNLDIEKIAVDTGIEDFAQNHDHYLYGLPKKS